MATGDRTTGPRTPTPSSLSTEMLTVTAAILPLQDPCRIPGLRSLGLWVSPLHTTPRLPPRGHFQDCYPSPFQRTKDLVLSGPWAHCSLWCSRPHWGVFNKSSTPYHRQGSYYTAKGVEPYESEPCLSFHGSGRRVQNPNPGACSPGLYWG